MILVIEDNFSSREMLCEFLEAYDFRVVSAEDGIAGLQMAKERLPDLIISDVDMPRMDGLQVLKNVRRDPITARIPFVVCTASTDQQYKKIAENLGVNAYFTKPLNLLALMQTVNQQLQR